MTDIIDVNKKGFSADGESYFDVATPEAIMLGYMVNVPVKIRFPNGRIKNGNKVMITPKGIDHFQREVPLSIRNTVGGAQ